MFDFVKETYFSLKLWFGNKTNSTTLYIEVIWMYKQLSCKLVQVRWYIGVPSPLLGLKIGTHCIKVNIHQLLSILTWDKKHKLQSCLKLFLVGHWTLPTPSSIPNSKHCHLYAKPPSEWVDFYYKGSPKIHFVTRLIKVIDFKEN